LFHRVSRFLVLIAAVQILGGHWAVLQTVAWTGMLVDFARRESLPVAVAKTFDGAHPCSLCHTVAEGRQQEQQQGAKVLIVKLDAVLPVRAELPARLVMAWSYFEDSKIPAVHTRLPLTPPPLA
jgi:hypothetical protein